MRVAKLERWPPSWEAILYGAARFPVQIIFYKKTIFAHERLRDPANLKGVRWVYEKEGQQPDGESQLVRVLPSEP